MPRLTIAAAIAAGALLLTVSSVAAHGDAEEVSEHGASAGQGGLDVSPEEASISGDIVLGTPEAPREIVITMTDQLRFEPATIAVGAGETVRFVLDNPTVAPHDFTLGDAEAQAHHHELMAAGMGHDHSADAHAEASGEHGAAANPHGHDAEPHGHGAVLEADLPEPVTLEPGALIELVATFGEPGELLIGCHVPGHWEAGMQGTIEVMAAPDLVAARSAG